MMRPDRSVLDRLQEELAGLERSDLLGELTLFAARSGKASNGELLVVGRAVNGGDAKFSARQLVDPWTRNELLDQLFAQTIPNGRCPMDWVGRFWGAQGASRSLAAHKLANPGSPGRLYNSRRSQFWRVVRRVALGVVPKASDRDWFSRIDWSNLYKVSSHRRGNPSAELMKAQYSRCCESLTRELQYLNPKRVLFLTGLDWGAPFLAHLGWTLKKSAEAITAVEASGFAFGRSIVVARHPQGKAESAFVNETLTAFERMA